MSVEAASRNRAAMPRTAVIVDEFRRVFGRGVQVRWAREGEVELGRRGADERSMSVDEWTRYLATGELP